MTKMLIEVAYPKQAGTESWNTGRSAELYDANGYATRRTYMFYADSAMNFQKGDLAVCPYATGDDRYVVCKVRAVHELVDGHRATRWAVQKVALREHLERIAEAAELVRVEKEFNRRMAEERRRLEDVLVLERNPELAELSATLDRLKRYL